jgi:hypothetical protein
MKLSFIFLLVSVNVFAQNNFTEWESLLLIGVG